MKGQGGLYRIILALQGMCMLGVAFGPFVDGLFDFSFLPFAWYKVIGFALNVSGFTFLLAALRTMHGSFTITVKPKESGDLVTHGVFGVCRNPIYFGGILMSFGWSISFASKLSLATSALLILVLFWKISYEEVELANKFGEKYRAYRESTAKLIPFLV